MKTSFHPSFFPITDTLNSVYKLGHQVETLFFFPAPHGLQYLSSLIRVWTWATTEKELSPNHWAAREIPRPCLRPVLVEPSSDPCWRFLTRIRPGTWPKVKDSHAGWACDPDPQALVLWCLWECAVRPARKWTLRGKERSERMKEKNIAWRWGRDRTEGCDQGFWN